MLLWRAPIEPKGIITGYEIQYSSGLTISLNSDDSYYKIDNRETVPEFNVQVIVQYIMSSQLFSVVAL